MGWMDVVHMPECQLCSLQHLLPLFEFDHFVSTCRMAKLDGFQRGRYEWLVDPPTTEGNPKFEYFFPTFGMSLSSPISLTVFAFLLQVTKHNRLPLLEIKGKRNWISWWPLFFIFSNLSSFFFLGLFGGDLVEGRFPKFSFIADSTRCGCVCLFQCFTFCAFKIC